MIGVMLAEATIGRWPDSRGGERQADRAAELEQKIRMFFEISAAIGLSCHEERTLLDVGQREILLLRVAPANAWQLGGSKLERRVTYAIPILQRMIAAVSC